MEDALHRKFTERSDHNLDAAHGCGALRDPRIAEIVAGWLRYFDGDRYRLLSFVLMPNHVHVLFAPGEEETLADTLKGWKGTSSRFVHRERLCDLHPFWQPDYFDRLIRGPEHLEQTIRYLRENPAMAGLTSGYVYREAVPC